jgi:surface antigen Omp85-like protein
MRPLVLLLLLLGSLSLPRPAAAQDAEPPEGTIIESADVSGLPLDELSPGLRRDIESLVGERLNRERLNQLASRIQDEHPEVIAAVRSIARPDDKARVVFVVALISDNGDLASNINARYVVEGVELSGIPEEQIGRSLRDRLQALVGRRLDNEEADDLTEDLREELPGHTVSRRIERGSAPGQIRVVFDVQEAPWIPFLPTRSKFIYHTDLGWSGALDIPMGSTSGRVTVGVAMDNKDDLLETYSGFRLRVESLKIGTPRLGAAMEFSKLQSSWQDSTAALVAASPDIPELYRSRLTVEPTLTFAVTPHVRISGGVSFSELESLARPSDSQMASAWIAAIGYDQRWRIDGDSTQKAEARYEVRVGSDALDTDLSYKRHLGRAQYHYQRGPNRVTAGFTAGYISGQAPLFERFSLGDSSTLRGWNKYDLAPAGGERMFHQSIEYSFHYFAVFFDTGSVWTPTTNQRIRTSTGFGFHGDNAFVTLAFPLDSGDAGARFMMGVRF